MSEVKWHRDAAVAVANALFGPRAKEFDVVRISENIALNDPTGPALEAVEKALTEIMEWFGTEYFIKPKPCGMCGLPDANCDYECVSAAGFSKDITAARAALAAIREARR